MATSFIAGFGAAGTTSVAFGVTTQAGDLIFLDGFRLNAAVVFPSGYTQLHATSQVVSGSTYYSALAYKIAAAGETATGTWAGAGSTTFSGGIYRASGGTLSVGATAAASTTGTAVASFGIPALTLQNTDGTSWIKVLAFTSTSTITLPASSPASLTTRAGYTAGFLKEGDTNGGRTSWASANATTIQNAFWWTYAAEIKFAANTTDAVGSAAGTAAAAGSSLSIVAGNAASAGVSAVAGVGGRTAAAAGVSSGSATATATGFAITPVGQGAGSASGLSTVNGAGTAVKPAIGVAAGTSAVAGANVQTVSAVGVAAGVATAIGKNYQPSRIIVGRLPSGAYGMRVSVPGYNASLDPVDDQKLIFSSEWPDVMPIYQRGSFVHRSTTASGQTPGYSVVQEIDYTTLGYVPFCDFTVRGNGDALPAGSDLYPSDQFYPYTALSLPYWDGSGTVTTAGDANAYLRLNVTANKICARSFVRFLTGTTTQGLPRTWTIYYTIYRKQAS